LLFLMRALNTGSWRELPSNGRDHTISRLAGSASSNLT
jgi:hypothetical protein